MTPGAPIVAPNAPGPLLMTPGLARRMACFVYEGVLLFGVLMGAGLVYAGVTDQRNAMIGRQGLQAFLFVVLGLYFTWFWSHGGQTVAMKTWHIRVQCKDGTPVSPARACARYVLSWAWFAPALTLLWMTPADGLWPTLGIVVAGVLVYAALAWSNPDRQFWHDIVCGTRVISSHQPGRQAAHG